MAVELPSSVARMAIQRSGSLALAMPVSSPFDDMPSAAYHLQPTSRGSDRRAHTRLTPAGPHCPISARLKYGEKVTLVDVSSGGALLETSRMLRPDTSLVLEILDARTRDVTPVVSRIVRAYVSGLRDGVTYRGACAFKRPLVHPALAPPPPLLKTDANDFLKLEFALKTIVEGYFRKPGGSGTAGRWRDESALLDALTRLRSAAERRETPIDRQLAHLLAAIVPALERHEAVESIVGLLKDLLSRHLPLLAIRPDGTPRASAHDRELMTLNVWAEPDETQVAVTAEFPAGFGLDEAQFRLLKAGAYLMALAGGWRHRVTEPEPEPEPEVLLQPELIATPAHAAVVEAPPPSVAESENLPVGWHRVVARHVDGQLLRGYTNDFQPNRGHLQLSPRLNCAALERLHVPVPRLKAVFFVKDFAGDPDRVDGHAFDHTPRARKIEVTFRDGEVMTGSTLSYKANAHGFFLVPADSRTNNTRIYVVTPAIRHMRFL